MVNHKPIPIGIEDFRRIIDDEHYYVDKTQMIQDILDNGSPVNLFTRPRRFGKTLNMSMLRYFFEISEKDMSYLFAGLHIAEVGESYMKYQGQYPVIAISLKNMKQPDYRQSFLEFKKLLNREFYRHRCVLRSDEISNADKAEYEAICNNTAADTSYLTAIRFLSDCLKTYYQKNVILLIDEYDVPLENAYFHGFYENMVNLVRSAFESALKTNDSLEYGILTGCLRISKESIFTGLNNLRVYSVTENEFSKYFGFTEQEVKEITDYYGIPEKFQELKEWYDGYQFGETEIYNPWSVLNYVQSVITTTSSLPKPYWSNTSSNDIIHELIVEGDAETRTQIEELLNGGNIRKPIYEDITYQNVKINSDYIWSFLLFTGYLKQIDSILEKTTIYSTMVIPNLEVESIYRNSVMQWFDEQTRNSDLASEVFDAAIHGDAVRFETTVNTLLMECISYFDKKENYYHGFLAGLLAGKRRYRVKSNRESGSGRPDILICEFQKHTIAVIIEIKVAEKFCCLDEKCDEALQQIEDQKYEAELLEDCYQKIIKYGVAFHDKTCCVKMQQN